MFAALYIPDFPMVAALRGRPDAQGRPCAVLATPAGTARQAKPGLLAVNPAARLAGIAAGWPLNRALVRCPDLRLLERDPAAEAALRGELIRIADSLTPDVEITAQDCVLLDLSLRSKALISPFESIVSSDFELFHAQSVTPDLAHLAVLHETTRGRVVVAADLAALPLEVLGWLAGGGSGGGELDLLDGWGLRTLGDFMKLPRQALEERLII